MKGTKKELVEATTNSVMPDNSGVNALATTDFSIDTEKSQEYQADQRDYFQPVGDEVKSRHWLFIIYLDSAPSNVFEQLENTGLAFAVSPYHDKDVNPSGGQKKPHFHVIISYNNTTTYKSIKGLRDITKGPYPLPCKSVGGAYAYFTHKHNPEKYPYDASEIKRYNGWEKVLEASDVSHIMKELTKLILLDDVQEYAELVAETMLMDGDYQQVVMSHTHYFDRLCASYRHSPVRTLKRFYNVLETDEERELLEKRITSFIYQQEDEKNESNGFKC